MRIVNQAESGNSWVSLGTYRFRGTAPAAAAGGDYVSLADITYEPYLSTQIAYDAVKWVPVGPSLRGEINNDPNAVNRPQLP